MNYVKVMMDAINNAPKTQRPMPSERTKSYPMMPNSRQRKLSKQRKERSKSRMKQRNPNSPKLSTMKYK